MNVNKTNASTTVSQFKYVPDIRIPITQEQEVQAQPVTGLAVPEGINFSTFSPHSARLFSVPSRTHPETLAQQRNVQQALQAREQKALFLNTVRLFYTQLQEHFSSGPNIICDVQESLLCTPKDENLEAFIEIQWTAIKQKFNQAQTLHIERNSNTWVITPF